MDARQYLAKKGLDGGKDEEKPNTLEELAWARARGASSKRPRSGTPHDWEDWDRYHEELAAGSEQLKQKIDHDKHLTYKSSDRDISRAPLRPSR